MKKIIVKTVMFIGFVAIVNLLLFKLSAPLTNSFYMGQLNGDGIDYNTMQLFIALKNWSGTFLFVTGILVYSKELKQLANKISTTTKRRKK